MRRFSTNKAIVAQIYRLHHQPVHAITFQSLVGKIPLSKNPEEHQKWLDTHSWSIVESAQRLHHEIPIRLAGRIVDLENLPYGLSQEEPVVALRDMLSESFEEMFEAPVPVDMKMEKAFMAMQMKIRNRHSEMHDNIKSVLSRHSIQDGSLLPAVLNNFYRSRIGIRMLVDHHMAIQQFEPGYTGIIQSKCTCSSIIHSVMDSIRKECGQSFSKVPTFTTEYHTDGSLTYIPKHVELITSEVLKFALLSSTENPNISIQLSSGSSGAVIKVSYKGNGIPYHQVPQVFSYLGSPSSSKVHDPVASDTDKRLGDLNSFDPFGMPIARQYARFFHGDLCVLPMEGHGVDVFIYLPDLG